MLDAYWVAEKNSRTEWPVQAARYAVPLSDTYGAGLLLTIRIGEGVHVGGVRFRAVFVAEQCELIGITDEFDCGVFPGDMGVYSYFSRAESVLNTFNFKLLLSIELSIFPG